MSNNRLLIFIVSRHVLILWLILQLVSMTNLPLAESFILQSALHRRSTGSFEGKDAVSQYSDDNQQRTSSTCRRKGPLYSAIKFKNFDQVLDRFRGETLLIYFETSKCGPCKLMKKELASAKKLLGEEIKIFSLDTTKWPHLATRYHVHRLPCILFVREGEIQTRMEGLTKAEVVAEQFRTLR
mmetsp:Transcript_4749/g.7404  ORF Transcript_4749/g.7404 Transcript_4749/m.7404 type:complete len:183 (+) Transcript_4749:218-766(+)